MIARFIQFLNQIRFFTILYVIQFAAAVNLVTTIIFSKDSYCNRFIIGILILSAYLILSGWFFIIQEYNYMKIKTISDESNENYDALIKRILKDKIQKYSIISGLIFLALSFFTIVKLLRLS